MYVPVATSIENYLPRRGEMISNVCDYLVTVLYHTMEVLIPSSLKVGRQPIKYHIILLFFSIYIIISLFDVIFFNLLFIVKMLI